MKRERFLDKEELGEWLHFPQTEHFLELMEKEVIKEREKYDTIEEEGKGKFKYQQGRVQGLLKAIGLAKNITEV